MIYFVRAVESGRIKIGYTAGDPLARLLDLRTGSPEELRLIGTIPGGMSDEGDLHRRFAVSRLSGEWFIPSADIVRFIAIRCADPQLSLLAGDVGYQRGYLDAVRRMAAVCRDAGSLEECLAVAAEMEAAVGDEDGGGIDTGRPEAMAAYLEFCLTREPFVGAGHTRPPGWRRAP